MRPVWWILGLTLSVYVLQSLAGVLFPGTIQPNGSSPIDRLFMLSNTQLGDFKLWTLVTYAFLHSTQNLFHIVFNMLMFFFLGRILAPELGTRRFVALYLVGTVVAGIVFCLVRWGQPDPVIGASGAVFAMLAFFCRTRMEEPMTFLLFFVLPLTVRPKWILFVASGMSLFLLLTQEFGERSHGEQAVAHSAHLGGIIGGLLFYHLLRAIRPRRRTAHSARPAIEKPSWVKRKRPASVANPNYRVNVTDRRALQSEVDRILDKINETGFGSLTTEEKALLDQAKDLLSR